MSLGLIPRSAVVAVLAAGAIVLAAATPTRASVITDSATLPLLGVPYVSTSGSHCFAGVGVCVVPGTSVLTAPVTSIFDATGQDITSGILVSATLTDLSNAPIASLSLSGTVEQEVLGRTSDTETGSWTTELTSLSLTGSALGFTVNVGLDPADASTGVTSITPISPSQFRVDSFFDVFVEIDVAGLSTTLGPIHVEAVPEPSSIAAMASALILMIGIVRWRRGTSRANPIT